MANSSAGDTATAATLLKLAPKSITAAVTTLTTDELAAGTPIEVYACGYAPGETITATVDYAGRTYTITDGTEVADELGCIGIAAALVAGTATAVSNRVSRRQAGRWAAQDQQRYEAQQYEAQQYQAPPQAAPQPAAPAGGGMDEKLAQLKELGVLKEQGLLTDAEFEAQKQRILNS